MKFCDYLLDRIGFILLYLIGICVALLAVWLDVAAASASITYEPFLYGLLLSGVLLAGYLMGDYLRRRPFYAQIERARDSKGDILAIESITRPVSKEEEMLTNLMRSMSQTYHARLLDFEREEEVRQHLSDRWVHYMKTPISVIDLMVQKSEHVDSVEDAKDLFHSIDEENQRLAQRLELFLNSVRIDKFEQDFRIESVDILEVSREVLNSHKKEFIHCSIFPKIECNESHLLVPTDRKWIKFVMEQAISNAIKYTKVAISPQKEDAKDETDEGKSSRVIKVVAKKVEDVAFLTIEDQGIGIPPEDIPRVFEPFFTGSNGRLLPESTGMGLYLARKVIGKLGHSISIQSEVGRGTAVTIRFAYDSVTEGVIERCS